LRYLGDLKHAHERGLHFDADIAEKSLRFVETVCTHQKAECAGKPFKLSPNQQFILWNIGEFTTTPRDCTAHWATDHPHQRPFSRRLNTIQSPLEKWTHSRGRSRIDAGERLRSRFAGVNLLADRANSLYESTDRS
jgi:hypothetical protein